MTDPTAPEPAPPGLDDWLQAAAGDPSAWWRLAAGARLALFDEAVERMQTQARHSQVLEVILTERGIEVPEIEPLRGTWHRPCCRACLDGVSVGALPALVCATCGDTHCPAAADHELACTSPATP